MDSRQTRSDFRPRLIEAMEDAGFNRSELARRVGIDRSTLSQILGRESDRLPRADTAAGMAQTLQVSLDWLMGLSQEKTLGQPTAILDQSLEIEPGDTETADRLLSQWHSEATGYKIRYVPTTLPDLMKTEAVIDYEYGQMLHQTAAEAQQRAARDLEYTRSPDTDVEVCSSVQALQGFARGEGIWQNLGHEQRREQLVDIRRLTKEMYPTFRWFLFDGQDLYSAPMTVFGPKRAVAYMGQMYFVYNTTEHIRVLAQHFDSLIRAAVVQPTELGKFVENLLNAKLN